MIGGKMKQAFFRFMVNRPDEEEDFSSVLLKQQTEENKMKDIFDTQRVDDLPENLKSGLKTGFGDKILRLFEMAERPLTIDELTVGYYRMFGGSTNRQSMMAKLYILAREPSSKIESCGKGIYRVKE